MIAYLPPTNYTLAWGGQHTWTPGWSTEQVRAYAVAEEQARRCKIEWQPIETAPKDESVILIGFAPHPRMEGSRRVYEGRWHELQRQWTSVNGFFLFTGASHWMPLPAAIRKGLPR